MNIYCPNCKEVKKISTNSKIFLSSNILIFLLNRDIDFSEKNFLLKIKLNLEEKIDLNNFIEESHSPKKYSLIGILSINLQDKKYVNFCESPIDKKWYFYNNEQKVKDIDLKEVFDKLNN